MHRYTVVLVPEPDGLGYNVKVPALPGCFTDGLTRAEALANAEEAIASYVLSLEDTGDPIPDDVPAEVVQVDASARIACARHAQG